MTTDEKYMSQCIALAQKGMGDVAPNPMVGCVIVHQNKIIGQGYHERYGEAHAEVNAIRSVEDSSLLNDSTLYVSLEPCAHYGKTPPCSDLIIEKKIPRVVIGCIDSYAEVAGKGIQNMMMAGIDVRVGILEKKALELNKRFFTFHAKKRPYITLKWAQTQDGFIDVDRSQNTQQDNWITSPTSKKLVHQWRSEEQAILIGTNTALNDNPQLTVREVEGKNPLRIVIDLSLRLPGTLHVFDGSTPTWIVNGIRNESQPNLEYVKIDPEKELIPQLLHLLYEHNILSLFVEGGATLLQAFLDADLWDEAKVFTGEISFGNGLPAPIIEQPPFQALQFDSDRLNIYVNA
ncbi:MAG: bifunctional diaminohydroxyphosphoribosylaminopyrimidine deaminase/5-amino-6-(5-phosphoribosylamino)uracil reductase RibD [Flavobacteriales bacterium]|nr:bifunctional diaminohydroxyphosphoribosylaminopyrimidine deaminase/5-amino-6-(5-phosphoribosylamino)uracil reductase RibD [Flavobacteriales bacterium]